MNLLLQNLCCERIFHPSLPLPPPNINLPSESAEQSLQTMAVRERLENQLRQRLQASDEKLVTAVAEIRGLRKVCARILFRLLS